MSIAAKNKNTALIKSKILEISFINKTAFTAMIIEKIIPNCLNKPNFRSIITKPAAISNNPNICINTIVVHDSNLLFLI